MPQRFPRRELFRRAIKIGGIATVTGAAGAGVLQLIYNRLAATKRFGRKYFSVKYRIEHTPNIATQEMIWFKQRGKAGSLVEAATARNPKRVYRRAPGPEDRSEIHTHIPLLIKKEYPANIVQLLVKERSMPSAIDLKNFLQDAKNSNLRACHFASINENGKVSGYISIRIGKKLLQIIQNQEPEMEKLSYFLNQKMTETEKLAGQNVPAEKIVEIAEKIQKLQTEALEELRKKGLQLHVKPMPGYELKDGFFQKKTK